MTLLGNSANNGAPPPICPDSATYEHEGNYSQEFYAQKAATNMNFADSTTNQCAGAKNQNANALDENRVGATLDGVPLYGKEFKTKDGHSNSGPSGFHQRRPHFHHDSQPSSSSSGPLDVLATAALNAQTNTTTFQPPRPVATGVGSRYVVDTNNKTHHPQGGQNAGKSGNGAPVMARASSFSHQQRESTVFSRVPQGFQPSERRHVLNEPSGEAATAAAGGQAAFKKQNESCSIHYDDSTTTHAGPRRVSDEQAPGDAAESPLREDLYDYTDQSDQEQELFVSDKKQGDTVDLTRDNKNAQAHKTVMPNVGKFSHPNGSQDWLDESDDDSSDDGIWETTGRTIRSKQVIHDDYLDSSPEKEPESPKEALLSQSPAKSLVGDFNALPMEQSPRSISPTYNDTDTDDSDFSLTTSRKSKKKKKHLKAIGKAKNALVGSSVDMPLFGDDTGPSTNRLTGNDQQSNKKRKRLVARKSTTPAFESARLQVSDRVYVEWATDEWYWGIIIAVSRSLKSPEHDQYSILFDDGDKLDVFRKSIITTPKFRAFFGREPPPLPNSQAIPTKSVVSMTPQQMYSSRCKKCHNCIKPNCGACWSCRTNKKSPSNPRLRVCLQKMCLELPDSQKKQSAKGVLPNDWKFMFTCDKPYNTKSGQRHVPGLFICHPLSDKQFRSIEAAVVLCPVLQRFNPNVIADFNRHIGVKSSSTATTTKRKRSPRAATVPSTLPVQVNTHVNVTEKPNGSVMTLVELFEARCNACENCCKEDCGKCVSCVSAGTTSTNRQVCIQKMCCNVPLAQKAQPMPTASMFPVGWKYVMDPKRKSCRQNGKVLGPSMTGAWGLKILSPSGQEYYSVERAISSSKNTLNDVNVDAFYEYIGAPNSELSSLTTKNLSATNAAATSKALVATTNDAPLMICGSCVNCTKPACGECARCASSSSGFSQRCFQKMCFKLPVEAKAEPAVGFPDGWRFFFAEEPVGSGSYTFEPVPGLNIRSPGNKKFRSVEATTVCSLGDVSDIARKFYAHVGLVDYIPKRQQSNQDSQVCDTSQRTSTKRLLSKYRVVGSRVVCFEGKARGRWGVITEKLEVTPNEYTFSVRLEEDHTLLEDLNSRSVLSEAMYRAKTGRTPPRAKEPGGDGNLVFVSPRKKTSGLAGQTIITTKDHFLVGKPFSFTWTDFLGRKKVLYGHVSECQKKEQNGEVQSFKVVYSEQCRAFINEINNGGAFVVPDSQMLPFAMVLGGCLNYEQQNGRMMQENSLLEDAGRLLHYYNWIIPDMRHEDFEEIDNIRVPRLTLVVREYRLELDVRESSIVGAGYGVYVSCTRLFGGENCSRSKPVILKAGELVDMGVYGPFRLEDKKPESVFFVKNFIHSRTCEEWAFDSGESQFQVDITDDVSGDIHAEAKKRIFAYVNESNVDGSVCIRAEHDPEGSVHYLLGHSHQSQGDFVLPSNGTPVEVFVNYGEGYEAVRVRKGYSFLPDGSVKKQSLTKSIQLADATDVKEMDRFGAAEVEAAVDFLFGLFAKDEDFSIRFIHRAIIVAVVLQRRARQLFLDGNNDTVDDAPSAVNMRKLLQRSRNVVTLLLGMVQGGTDESKSLHAAGNVDKLCALVLKTSFSESEFAKLGDLVE